ncbi:carboxypeptidase-like regulatory domain-containing protein [Pedobacter sp. HMF7647]|uniref:Carboxypeptidase-like regulatory domain-containing protein n=1 Tax=Hufsiella arboris TaxID=2695275 RepID=A0A7K1Y427_9SPHI|nr:DUF5686 family protein [Hufsiella arboris]MXV49337.1 carboxypeptidase-like regulatory domain-containing protein [Hufsiella arboris]
MKNFTLLILFFLVFRANAQQFTVSGKITDTHGNVVPFAAISDERSGLRIATNAFGLYSMRLNAGVSRLDVGYIGYETVTRDFELRADTVIDVVLSQTAYKMSDSASNVAYQKKHAKQIMDNVIAGRKKHLEQISDYSMDVYTKGEQWLLKAPKKFLGQDVSKILQLGSAGKGIIYLSEAHSKVYYKAPDHFHIEMEASRAAGRNGSFSINKTADLVINFYNNIIQFDSLAVRGFVSPLADFADMYYRYRYLGSAQENGKTIDKIQVIPRRKYDPVFRGVLYIVEDSWQLHSLDLYLTKASRINFIDTLKIKQQLKPVKDDIWMQSFVEMDFASKLLGFQFSGSFLGVCQNQQVNIPLPADLFNGETLKVPVNNLTKSREYLNAKRPVMLTPEEISNFSVQDSMQQLLAIKAKKDSLIKQTNKITFMKVAAGGYVWRDNTTKRLIKFDAILPDIFYNTVEGFGFQYNATFRKEYNLKNWIEITPQIRYGFSNGHFNPRIEGRYYYDPINKGYLRLVAGKEVLDLTGLQSSKSITNSINTLIYETNWRKFYERSVLGFSGSYEAFAGFFFKGDMEYSRRFTLKNTSDFVLIDRPGKEFTSNNPFTPAYEIALFPEHTAFILKGEIDYGPAARYVTRPEGRFYENFKYPRLSVTYRKALNVFNANSKFDFGSFEVYQNSLKMGLWGKVSYTFKLGKFFNRDVLYYPDYYHFRGNNSLLFEQSLRNFHYLDIYRFSADKQFFEAHLEQNFGGFITNKIPLLRLLKLDEIVGGAYLDQPSTKNYYEIFFGLQRLIFRVDYAMAYSMNQRVYSGFKFTYNIH